MAKRKLKIFANPDYGDEGCPACGCDFVAPFSLSVCRTCGMVSMGCNMCPLNKFECCGTAKCPIKGHVDLYAIFTKKEFKTLPDAYKIYAPAKAVSFSILMVKNRLIHIYSERALVGFTTIDMEKWREGDPELKGVPEVSAITFAEN
jgi:hypothetical protein